MTIKKNLKKTKVLGKNRISYPAKIQGPLTRSRMAKLTNKDRSDVILTDYAMSKLTISCSEPLFEGYREQLQTEHAELSNEIINGNLWDSTLTLKGDRASQQRKLNLSPLPVTRGELPNEEPPGSFFDYQEETR
jgi:hypothetical protein